MSIISKEPGSFRDPDGFLFYRDGIIFRQINKSAAEKYDRLMSSGLYERLVNRGYLVEHEEVDLGFTATDEAYKILKPQKIPFISYPYEWCFSQLKNAALTTIEIQRIALEHGMSLKDASAYNIQFLKGRTVFIDTLSFDIYIEGAPWTAYRQFCRHFLAPLVLMKFRDHRLNQLLRDNIDGIPLDLTASLLPFRACLRIGILTHIFLHSASEKRYSQTIPTEKQKSARVSQHSMLAILDNLKSTIDKLKWQPGGTEWADYYEQTSYEKDSLELKKQFICDTLDETKPSSVWDIGANTGLFSRLASDMGIHTVAWDIDYSAVELNYLQVVKNGETSLLPLLQDLTNPSPSIGWNHCERKSLHDRAPTDMIFALALVHHFAIVNNVPLDNLAKFFSDLGAGLIVEFVPKSDPMVTKLLATREDIFPDYNMQGFETAFKNHFEIIRSETLIPSGRIIYYMQRK